MDAATDLLQGAIALLASPRLKNSANRLDMLTDIRGANEWYADRLQHLWSKLILNFTVMTKNYNDREQDLALADPALLAWRARNLVELGVWISYCISDKDRARRFYEDKARDFIDWTTAAQKLYALLPGKASGIQNIEESKERIRQLGEREGMTDLDDRYTRVYQAAEVLGQHTQFAPLNKILSKFAHPTAFTLLSLTDKSSRATICEVFMLVGAAYFMASFEEFELFLNTAVDH